MCSYMYLHGPSGNKESRKRAFRLLKQKVEFATATDARQQSKALFFDPTAIVFNFFLLITFHISNPASRIYPLIRLCDSQFFENTMPAPQKVFIKFYADTRQGTNLHFKFRISSARNAVSTLKRFQAKGFRIRAAWCETLCKATGTVTNERIAVPLLTSASNTKTVSLNTAVTLSGHVQ